MTFQTANEVTINDDLKNKKLVFMQARFNNKKTNRIKILKIMNN